MNVPELDTCGDGGKPEFVPGHGYGSVGVGPQCGESVKSEICDGLGAMSGPGAGNCGGGGGAGTGVGARSTGRESSPAPTTASLGSMGKGRDTPSSPVPLDRASGRSPSISSPEVSSTSGFAALWGTLFAPLLNSPSFVFAFFHLDGPTRRTGGIWSLVAACMEGTGSIILIFGTSLYFYTPLLRTNRERRSANLSTGVSVLGKEVLDSLNQARFILLVPCLQSAILYLC